MQQTALPLLERFLKQTGMNETQAIRLMQSAVDHEEQVMNRARRVVAAIEAIDDERFTLEALRANPEAMQAIENGVGVGEVYRRYFLRAAVHPQAERSANLGFEGVQGERLTPDEIERISAYVSATGNRYEID